ncbi:unnamed protein product, partial [Didymodactylos carnosus]
FNLQLMYDEPKGIKMSVVTLKYVAAQSGSTVDVFTGMIKSGFGKGKTMKIEIMTSKATATGKRTDADPETATYAPATLTI